MLSKRGVGLRASDVKEIVGSTEMKGMKYDRSMDVEKGKPFPYIFLLATESMAAEPKNCLAIGDAQNGVEASKRAGMTCIAVPNQVTRDQDHSAAAVVHSLKDMDLRFIWQINLQRRGETTRRFL